MDPNRNPMVFTMDSAMFQMGGFPGFPGVSQGGSRPGDNDYKQFPLPHFLETERMCLNLPENKERAFIMANKATTALDMRQFETAEKMSFHALSLDSSCIDAWRTLTKCITPVGDGDTVVCGLREVLNFAKPFYKNEFENEHGRFYSIASTRPYIRILTDLGQVAMQSEMLDVAIYVYEEILRLNWGDNTGSRDPLLACYLKLIGRIIRFPKTKPVRTIDQAMALINYEYDFDGSKEPLFGCDSITVRWAKIAFAYAKKDKNWKNLAKAENKKNPLMVKVLFNEVDINSLQPSSPIGIGFVLGDPNDDVRSNGPLIKEALKDWPALLIELYNLLRGKIPARFIEDIHAQAPNPESEMTKEYKDHMTKIGNEYLNKGRNSLSNRRFLEAVQHFTFAKRGFYEAAQPSRRFYLHAPFAIESNRATAASALFKWNITRVDTRYTLAMKPDHARSYTKVPEICKAFQANQIIKEAEDIAKDVQANPTKTPEQWKELSSLVIALLSIPSLAAAHDGKLTQEKRESLIKIGIDDMYAPVNVDPSINPILPWLTAKDIEPPIEKK